MVCISTTHLLVLPDYFVQPQGARHIVLRSIGKVRKLAADTVVWQSSSALFFNTQN